MTYKTRPNRVEELLALKYRILQLKDPPAKTIAAIEAEIRSAERQRQKDKNATAQTRTDKQAHLR